jgi:DNA polymerase
MLFYDFEVFKYDWLTVIFDTDKRKEHVIINDENALQQVYNDNKNNIWTGFNVLHYDQYILKAILCGFDPKRVNDHIIVKGKPGWSFSSLLRQVSLISYDVMLNLDKGLKWFEGSMGHNIKETSVPFDIDRKLTDDEIAETVKYCREDVKEAMELFLRRKEEFEGRLGLVKLACKDSGLDLSLLSKTKPQLSALILGAVRPTDEWDDEFEIDFPDTMKIEKYTKVVDWYKDENNRCYARHIPGRKTPEKTKLDIDIAGVPHTFAWGGVHGALENYHGKGFFLNMDVASLYPSLMIRYGLLSRNVRDPEKYTEIKNERIRLKKLHDPLQAVLKIVLNSTYGVMKDKNNALYDPRQANRVCVYGQLLLLDLIEKLEPYAEVIQSNTDGVLIKMPENVPGNLLNNAEDTWYSLIDDIAYEWEKRTGLQLEFDEYTEIYQKDVNNYVVIAEDGHYKSKGAYVKGLSDIDYGDFPIINEALIQYMVHKIPIETTIMNCNELKKFQYVAKITSKYKCILHGEREIKEKCIRVFASTLHDDKGVSKVSVRTGKPEKISNSPEKCFLYNENINGVPCPSKLDRQWYIRKAKERLENFGVHK